MFKMLRKVTKQNEIVLIFGNDDGSKRANVSVTLGNPRDYGRPSHSPLCFAILFDPELNGQIYPAPRKSIQISSITLTSDYRDVFEPDDPTLARYIESLIDKHYPPSSSDPKPADQAGDDRPAPTAARDIPQIVKVEKIRAGLYEYTDKWDQVWIIQESPWYEFPEVSREWWLGTERDAAADQYPTKRAALAALAGTLAKREQAEAADQVDQAPSSSQPAQLADVLAELNAKFDSDAVKIGTGRNDRGAWHRAIELARKFRAADLWDGRAQLWINDVYNVHSRVCGISRTPIADLVDGQDYTIAR